jgi:ankyrin repeat protein
MRYTKRIPILFIAAVAMTMGCDSQPHPSGFYRGYYPRLGPLKPHEVFSDENVVALAVAAQEGRIEDLNRLSERGVDVNTVGRGSITPLVCAFAASNKAGYKRLLELGANPNVQMENGLGIMSFASSAADDSEWIELALRFGGDPNLVYTKSRSCPKRTPIFDTISSHHVRAAELLIEAGADLTHKSRHGQTPLGFALINHRYDIIYLLLQAGADHRDGLVLRETAIERTRRYLEERDGRFREPEQVPWAEKCLKIIEERERRETARDSEIEPE